MCSSAPTTVCKVAYLEVCADNALTYMEMHVCAYKEYINRGRVDKGTDIFLQFLSP